jgi:uncharacterized protein DUF2851
MGKETTGPIAEIDLCRAWTRLPRSIPLTTTDGRSVDVIHLGSWTHGFGPDFRNAIISIDGGPTEHGSVELHLRTRGWSDHRHHLDPRYNDVILHIVGQHDEVETRRSDGKLVPTVVLDIRALGLPTHEVDWSLVGGAVCAERLAREQPDLIRGIVERLGDNRITARAARIESRLTETTPDAVLYAEILDALGYVSNRDPMAAIVSRLPWTNLVVIAGQETDTFDRTLAALLGVGGFLPLSDAEIAYTGLDPDRAHTLTKIWAGIAWEWDVKPITPTDWILARIRPSNHPIRRLVQAAALVTGSDFHLTAQLLDPLRAAADPTTFLMELVDRQDVPALGIDRARAIVTNVLVPFGFVLASQTGDADLAESTARVWESLPGAESNERTRRAVRQITGDVGMKRLGARLQQGLIHLDQSLCGPRRCYECPIAAVVVRESAADGISLG